MNCVEFVFTKCGHYPRLSCCLELLDKNVVGKRSSCNWCFYCDDFLRRDTYLKKMLNSTYSYYWFAKEALLKILNDYLALDYDFDVILNGKVYNYKDFLRKDTKENLDVIDFVDFIFDYLVVSSNSDKGD